MTPTAPPFANANELLEMLGEFAPAAPFRFALCHPEGGALAARTIGCGCCCDGTTDDCRDTHSRALAEILRNQQALAYHCGGGRVNLAIPFRDADDLPWCLFGTTSANPPSLAEAGRSGEAIQRLLPSLLAANLDTLALDRASARLQAVTEVSAAIDQAETPDDAAALLSEALVVLFDLPRVIVVADDNGNSGLRSWATLGQPLAGLNQPRLATWLLKHAGEPVSLHQELDELFPGCGARSGLLVPLCDGGRSFGLTALLDPPPLHPRDRRLVQLLCGRAAGRWVRLEEQRARQQESAFAEQLITLFGALSLIEDGAQLHQSIVDLSAELVGADSGSLMLLHDGGETLHIVASRGLNPPLARSLSIRLGEGIAGRVAKNGFPLLVADIERDERVGIANRPRFRSKSFLSIPLTNKDRVIGVLNLADKADGKIFHDGDLKLLNALSSHAAAMILRVASQERTAQLEQMSVTDPLTGLYNRRFLEKRLEEELSRSRRHRLNFTVMLVDLDYFKAYNDSSGHLAGDAALRQTAGLLTGSAREMDIVARYGGEEFCLVLPGTSKKESLFVAERIRRAIEQSPFANEEQLPLGKLTGSIGIASFPADGETALALIHAADIALYRAKHEGRNRYILADPALLHDKESHA